MVISTQSEIQKERRHQTSIDNNDVWQKLTLAQKFSASSLTQFGFELNFIRDYHASHVAILTCNESVASISKGGEINTTPAIELRY